MKNDIKEIIDILKDKIKNLDIKQSSSSFGKVVSVGDSIIILKGLDDVMFGELLKFKNNTLAWVLSIEEDYIKAVLLRDDVSIKTHDEVYKTNKTLFVPVGDQLLSRIINPLGKPLDNKEDFDLSTAESIEKPAFGIMEREEVNQPIETGILLIDSLIPIGKGQRELIIGDRQIGKTSICLDTIINQKGKNVYCVYVSIGQKKSEISRNIDKLKKFGALKHTTLIIASASDTPTLQYIAPYSAMSIAEEWMKKGKDVLVVFDDLTKHADAYRTLSLLLKNSSGREAYPGDIFYIHSKLLERSTKLSKKNKNGSITALPIVETLAADISAYIPTNIISITDGQIYLTTDLFNSNIKPAVDVGLSVSRVGSTAQKPLMKKLTSSLKLDLSYFRELKTFLKFSTDIDEKSKKIIDNGFKIIELLKQQKHELLDYDQQLLLLYAINKKLIKWLPTKQIISWKKYLLDSYKKPLKENKELKKLLLSESKLTKDLIEKLDSFISINIYQFILTLNDYKYADFGPRSQWLEFKKHYDKK